MASPLEKARKDPESVKAKILMAARRIFGVYGFHGTTIRMVAQELGMDISTLHYHWGDKRDLYEAVVLDINHDLGQNLINVEKTIHGLPLPDRLAISIDYMTDYLFEHPEISNLIMHRHFGKTREEAGIDFKVPEFTYDIARSMGLVKDKKSVSSHVMLMVLALMNSMHCFISGEDYFRPIVALNREEYIAEAKKALKFIHIPAFTQDSAQSGK
ncbi:MAG: TetR/AcrR family transcriptional regulator [Deltaproteobacteria bacterium HGW-Deltaproteobacteria-10]|nr:MAG: TetR/AcrR family transcriptional regulator [Deltaproteobacteria bacterium HGW-Deltaproteobacteria-10]